MGALRHGHAFDPTRSFEAACKLLKQAPGTVMVGGLLLFFLEGGGSGGFQGIYQFRHGMGADGREFRRLFEDVQPWLLLLVPLIACVGLAFFALSSWIQVGFARAVEHALRTGRDDVGMIFSGGDRLGPMLLARFLCVLVGIGTTLPIGAAVFALVMFSAHGNPPLIVGFGCVLFGLLWLIVAAYIGLGLLLVKPIVALEKCSPTEAIARSWQLSSGQRWRLLWFVIFQLFMAIAGICLCCVGTFITAPLIQVMRMEVYIALAKGDEYPHWWIGSSKFPFDGQPGEGFGSPPSPLATPPSEPPPVPPPLPPQS